MQLWKQLHSRLEPHFNRALLLSILACLVILLTYLFGGAGAFVTLRQKLFPQTASSVVTTNSPSSHASTTNGANGTTSTKGEAATPGVAVPVVGGSATLSLQVSPLDVPLDCALGAGATSSVTLTNPDSASHSFALAWNGTSPSIPGFSALSPSGATVGTVPAHGTQAITVSALPLSLDPNADSQYLWVTDNTAGASNVVAKVHVSCSTLPAGLRAVPSPTVPPLPTLP